MELDWGEGCVILAERQVTSEHYQPLLGHIQQTEHTDEGIAANPRGKAFPEEKASGGSIGQSHQVVVLPAGMHEPIASLCHTILNILFVFLPCSP